MESESLNFDSLLQCVKQLPNGELTHQLRQLNEQKCVRDAELLLYLSELDQRGLYRQEAVSSLFDFCVSRLGCSEDVAWKRVGAARLMRRFPLVFDLLCSGRIHLSALMLVKPQLTEENHREWLLAASGKSKRQVEMLVARRCPKPDVATSMRKLPEPRTLRNEESSSQATSTSSAATQLPIAATATPVDTTATSTAEPPVLSGAPSVSSAASPTSSAASPASSATAPWDAPHAAAPLVQAAVLQTVTVGERTSIIPPGGATAENATQRGILREDATHHAVAPNAVTTARIAPLSGSTYRVTFTASERWKQKFERARELASHVIPPSDLPGLLERALDLLILREERRRCAFGVTSRATGRQYRDAESQVDSKTQADPKDQAESRQQPCQMRRIGNASQQDPGRVAESDAGDRTLPDENNGPLGSAPCPKPRSRYIPAAVRREIWQRDQGRCTFTDAQGNRCEERCFLEVEHLEPFARNGATSVSNCTLRCACHNTLAAEESFGRSSIESAIARARKHRSTIAHAQAPTSSGILLRPTELWPDKPRE